VHQFTRVGSLAMMQGGAAISKDLPPFTVALRENEMCGLNVVGLRRAGFGPAERLELKRLYHQLFRGGRNLREATRDAQARFTSPAAQRLLTFLTSATRGVCSDVGAARNTAETGQDNPDSL
jgi:UDP-N-acetylglucosamine acyltransferase